MRVNGKNCWKVSLACLASLAIGASSAQAGYVDTLQGMSGLVSHWSLEETTGTTADDSVAGFDGFNTGSIHAGKGASLNAAGPRPSDGFLGFSASNSGIGFNGSSGTAADDADSQRLRMNHAGYTGTGGLVSATVAMWFKIDDPSDQHDHLGGLQNDTTGGAYGLALNHYGTGSSSQQGLRLFARAGTAPASFSTSYGNEYRDGLWHLAVGTIEPLSPDTRLVSMYVDGALVSTDTTGGSALSATDTLAARTSLQFGQDATNVRGLLGQLDEIAMFDRSLDAGEVSALWAAAHVPEPTAGSMFLVGLLGLAMRRRS